MKSTFLISVILIVIVSFPNINYAQEKIDFGYVGKKGPAFWHLLPKSTLCGTGKKQSPIDITSGDLKVLAKPPPASFKDAKDVESTNNGKTVEISSGTEGVPLPAEITVDGEKYKLQQFHFHTPSEHRINNHHFDIEQHLVFKSETKKLSVVVAIFYNVDKKESKFMAPIVKDLPKKSGEKKEIGEIGLSDLLKNIDNISQAYTYSGSLTTPPCNESVTWYVNKNPQQVSLDQFLKLRDVMGFNSRFTQLKESDY